MDAKEFQISESIQKAFEEACQRKGIEPNLPGVDGLDPAHKKAVISFYILSVLIDAINGDWRPDFTDWRQPKYAIWWDFIESDGGYADLGLYAGLAYSNSHYSAAYVNALIGSRLCFKSRELARKAAVDYAPLFENVLLPACV